MKDFDLQVDKVGARLKEARLAKDMTLDQFYRPVTEHISNCSAIENGHRKIGKRLSKDIIEYHHINVEWINTGTGPLFIETAGLLNNEPAGAGVPYFNVNFIDGDPGKLSLFNEPPEYYVNYRPLNDCDAYLPVYGDSMNPKYISGEIIAIKEIRNFDIIQWGEAYLVIGNEQANHITTVKLLFEHSNQNKIVLRSSNPEYKGDTVLDKAMIKHLFIVKGKVTRNQF